MFLEDPNAIFTLRLTKKGEFGLSLMLLGVLV